MRFKGYFLLFILLVLATAGVHSQDTLSRKCVIAWNDLQQFNGSEITGLHDLLGYAGGDISYTSEGLPVYDLNIPLNPDQTIKSVMIHNQESIGVNPADFPLLDISMVNAGDFEFSYTTQSSRKAKYAVISVQAVKHNTPGTGLDILKSFSVELITGNDQKPLPVLKAGEHKQNSVLATGDWFKFRLNKNGIHKITYQDLSEMGFDLKQIDPRNLKIYGNGGGMLPESNSIPVPDDLMENAIFVAGESDGSFDQNDYILFYGEGPTEWNYSALISANRHTTNLYSDYTCYFITADGNPGKRIATQNSHPGAADKVITTYEAYDLYEFDEVNLVGTGRHWYQKMPGNELIIDFNTPNLRTSEQVKVRARMAARSYSSSSFWISAGSEQIGNVFMSAVSTGPYSSYADENSFTGSFLPQQKDISIKINYVPTTTQAIGWFDYLEINYMADIRLSESQLQYRNFASVSPGQITEFRISDAGSNTQVWNVTDPYNVKNISGNFQGNIFTYKIPTDSLLEFVAFDATSFRSVEFVEKVRNQNLHSLPTPDYVIITHPDFYHQAVRLADYHRQKSDMLVHVTEIDKVYNEFSSGAKDVTAIRNYMRMFYQRTDGNKLKYLLLFGDASYDYKDRINNNTDFVPSWETEASLKLTTSYVTDDYYGLLDQDEGSGGDAMPGKIDLGIGRLPVMTEQQAKDAVDKILHYAANSHEVMRPWRNTICFIADDEDSNGHFRDAENLASYVENNIRDINIEKIYLDAYPQQHTPSGQRYPGVREDINKTVEKGALVINYSGHGGELGLAHEQVLTISDVNSWQNFNNLPVFITATCEFSRYDDPTRTSAGELVFLNPQGGAIAMFTTTRATYASYNYNLNKKFYEYGFRKINGEYPALGDILRLSKTALGKETNKRKYALLGDPALKLAYPRDSVLTTKINGYEISDVPDTLKALAKVSIAGSLFDCQGNKLDNFNGTLFPTVYDKETKATTFGQDKTSNPANFSVRKNIVYKGKTPVVNGDFMFSFIVPKDIAYNFGSGRISYYARSENTDATGYFENFVVGGFEEGVIPDTVGPEIELYINDTNFAHGGITDENPHLLAFFRDESGINTVGNGIGHDITAVLNNEKSAPYILNEYYESDLGDYTSGALSYPFFQLREGKHIIDLKVWDVYNNSSDASIAFVVVNGSEFIIEDLINYPNPMQYETNFVFEHNQPGKDMDIEIQIFNMSGKLERTIKQNKVSTGYRSEPVRWDGTGNTGEKLGTGFYIYRLIVRDGDGIAAEQTGKLILVNR